MFEQEAKIDVVEVMEEQVGDDGTVLWGTRINKPLEGVLGNDLHVATELGEFTVNRITNHGEAVDEYQTSFLVGGKLLCELKELRSVARTELDQSVGRRCKPLEGAEENSGVAHDPIDSLQIAS